MSIKTSIILDHFKSLSDVYHKMDDTNRAATFTTASINIKDAYPENLPEDLNEVLKIRGIGPSCLTEIKQVISTGTSTRLKDIQEKSGTATVDFASTLSKLKGLLKK